MGYKSESISKENKSQNAECRYENLNKKQRCELGNHKQQQQQQQRGKGNKRSRSRDRCKLNKKNQRHQHEHKSQRLSKCFKNTRCNEMTNLNDKTDETASITSTTSYDGSITAQEEESALICRHCLRPQSELQRHLRTQQQKNNKRRQHHGKSRKDIKCDRQILSSNASLWKDINAVNEQAIRFRCPQVGPQVGRNLHPAPMHFHHPQHQQQIAYQQQQILQQYQYAQSYTNFYQYQPMKQHENIRPERTHHNNDVTSFKIEYESHQNFKKVNEILAQTRVNQRVMLESGACSNNLKQQHPSKIIKQAPNCFAADLITRTHQQTAVQHTATSKKTSDQLHLKATKQTSTTPNSPSLVKVRTWYTVTKQDVSC